MIYLDSAATTLQKPPTVRQAMSRAVERMASPGRGGHKPSALAAETAFQCRQAAAELFHLSNPENVIFTLNATHALNLAIKSVVKPGSVVVVSGYEHNAVTRPLTALGCEIRIARSPLFESQTILGAFEAAITDEVSCVICNHVSNVFGFILPVREIAQMCHRKNIPFILDASQSAGALPVHMDELDCAFIGMPGHKGLYGPQGTGLLLCGHEQKATPLIEGGTGSLSAQQDMPDFYPDRLEPGTHNIPGIAGLLEGIRFVTRRGEHTILSHERLLAQQAMRELSRIPQVKVYAANDPAGQAGLFSFLIRGMDCEETGERLSKRGIAVRAGLHCAPYAHQSAGTEATGTVRVSFSAFNTREDVRVLIREVAEIAK